MNLFKSLTDFTQITKTGLEEFFLMLLLGEKYFQNMLTQPTISCSKLTMKTLEQGVKYNES